MDINLDYAGNLDEMEQYKFLCDMLPIIPELILEKYIILMMKM